MPLALAVRHVAFEDLGLFEPVLAAAGFTVQYFDVGLDAFDERLLAADLLLVLGGPIGVYELAKYPWLQAEIDLIGQRLHALLPTVGICLGAQLMASALGAHVGPGRGKEIGFKPLTLTAAGLQSPLAAFAGLPVLHWHGDCFDLPADATSLAFTDLCPQQAFAIGRHALGFQFHPEAGGAGFERWLVGHSAELAADGFDVPTLRADYARLAPQLSEPAAACLSRWLKDCADSEA